jgi:hypothetical protein
MLLLAVVIEDHLAQLVVAGGLNAFLMVEMDFRVIERNI